MMIELLMDGAIPCHSCGFRADKDGTPWVSYDAMGRYAVRVLAGGALEIRNRSTGEIQVAHPPRIEDRTDD